MVPGCSWRLAALCLSLILLWVSEAAVYQGLGKCKYKDKIFKPGQKFQRGCDKCYCAEGGYYCVTPMRPTSWPKKCKPIYMDCGYRIVYRSDPERECYAYSWVG
ncbi:uncharacterized protein LOC122558875 isoform X1 [Chiloscyllium plagiosum]|uniref:uncharacterized protein LOC122558875 isoform X1 n=1 Tax=Chiloscyllium plagiosum TaxID=36176 RepID=UPI001CB7C442|nr:uncharacterized protein LOC122558875 isoform X1 [Chiloscyllium plagiosum]